MQTSSLRQQLLSGLVIPAHPLALNSNRELDEKHQRALSRYYLAAGAGGLAVGVHTTQFAIHDEKVGLYEPVLSLAAEEITRSGQTKTVRVAGIVGTTKQATHEASIARELGYSCGLLSLSALRGSSEEEIFSHCRAVADVLPVFGFYLQEGIGGISLPYSFWKKFVEIENVVAIKIAAFNRYQTIDVVRALAESGREDIALYTGNDDTIVTDLMTSYEFSNTADAKPVKFSGGLLGHWAVWTKSAVDLLSEIKTIKNGETIPARYLSIANQVTDMNAVIFDAANEFRGCIPGILEVLRRQGLVPGCWCLDEAETMSKGQAAEIDRICAAYPHLIDDKFVQAHRDEWLT
ncbi:Dihydrodipicolinate synthetase family protein [Thalassoglobus neptunius]|uniref:Dihydrodipicolinate synthetase family protein n=1 Tax=Thalassoglobus neptunius TaxID=1938619 RepID=A0A5C5WEX4_9PLAN|nr:dihydrodipicolinate synthase family protein [Thalassoglobus neptunius]TWT49067.1 Dihydrodipicolinate synthetase family protein [Thalassoglobus neptunius]